MSCHVAKPVALTELVCEENTNVPYPRCCWYVLSRELRCELIVDVENGEDFGSRDAVEDDEEKDGKGIVERYALVHTARTSLGTILGGRREDGVPDLSQEWVENEEGGGIGQVASECLVLEVGVIDLAPRYPAVRQILFVLVISMIRGFRAKSAGVRIEGKRECHSRVETLYGTQNIYGTARRKTR